jgi:hypothetical protein
VVAKKAAPRPEAFIADLPQPLYAKTPEELMQIVARQTKTIDGKMPTLFLCCAAALRHSKLPARRRQLITRDRRRMASLALICQHVET